MSAGPSPALVTVFRVPSLLIESKLCLPFTMILIQYTGGKTDFLQSAVQIGLIEEGFTYLLSNDVQEVETISVDCWNWMWRQIFMWKSTWKSRWDPMENWRLFKEFLFALGCHQSSIVQKPKPFMGPDHLESIALKMIVRKIDNLLCNRRRVPALPNILLQKKCCIVKQGSVIFYSAIENS